MSNIPETVLALSIGIVYFYFYAKRNSTDYERGKTKSISSGVTLRMLYKYLILSTAAFTIASFWSDSPLLLKFYDFYFLRYFGLAITSLGTVLFVSSILVLGDNYSPCYDLYVPNDFVQKGAYRYMRHPIYIANVGVVFGCFIASGNFFVMINTLILILYYYRSAKVEEVILESTFEKYRTYVDETNMFIPGLGQMKKRNKGNDVDSKIVDF